jgi:hypothetical protein
MHQNTFEEKVKVFAKEEGWIPFEFLNNESEKSLFNITIISNEEQKFLLFKSLCSNVHITFEIKDTNLDSLFNKAFRAIHVMNRICNPNATRKKVNKED